jgi:hypothetical protein
MKKPGAALPVRRRIALAAAGVAGVAFAFAAGAQAAVSPPPIIGSFAYHETDTPDGRCSWGWGLQFAPIAGVTDYSWTYYDGYWKSDFDSSETSAEFLAETYSTPALYFHGITGGSGPQPCTSGGADDGGRFPQAPLIYPVYPDGKNPPLSKSTSSSKPGGAGRATLQAAAGTFPVGSTASIGVVLKSNHALTGFRVSHVHLSGGAIVVQQPELESLTIPAHSPQSFTAQIEGKRPGRVTLKVTFTGRYSPGKAKKAEKVTITTSSSLLFGSA